MLPDVSCGVPLLASGSALNKSGGDDDTGGALVPDCAPTEVFAVSLAAAIASSGGSIVDGRPRGSIAIAVAVAVAVDRRAGMSESDRDAASESSV